MLILILGFILRCFVSSDMYLHEWDERFHAVIAKNILAHPLKPTLYDTPVLDYDHRNWATNHVWLSKPPLPFWVIGASMAVFGKNELGLRFPSIIFSLMCILLTVQIGRLLFNQKVGLIAGFFHAIHGLHLELTGGLISSDHVDILFLLFFELGILFIIKYIKNNKSKYLIYIGLCVGLAYLCKWIMAFFLFFIWIGIYFLIKRNIRELVSKTLVIILTFLIVALPWQLFILHQYSEEAQWIFRQMFAPIQTKSSTVGHSGGIFFYLIHIRIIFGELIYIPLIWLVFKCFNINIQGISKMPCSSHTTIFSKKRIHLWILFLWIFLPLILLSISAMKKHTYVMMSAPAFFILTAFFIIYFLKIQNKIHTKTWMNYIFVALLILLPIRYSIERIKPFKQRMELLDWRIRLSDLNNGISMTQNKVILSHEPHYMNAMFYYDFIAYEKRLTPKEIKILTKKGYKVFENQNKKYIERSSDFGVSE